MLTFNVILGYQDSGAARSKKARKVDGEFSIWEREIAVPTFLFFFFLFLIFNLMHYVKSRGRNVNLLHEGPVYFISHTKFSYFLI